MSKVYSLKCPNCAGPLELLGGGRVQTVTCPYCKSVIDLNDNYKVLYNFKNSQVPNVPFKIGMRGEIEGIEWTIIGWIVYRSEDDVNDKWSEFLLFSPLYGYSWLIYEGGKISFSKRVRDFNLQKWEENSSTAFYRRGHYLLEEEAYNSLVYFVQGELTWIAKKNDKIRYWDYKKSTKESLSIEQSHNELEVYYSKKVDAKKVYESFGVTKEQQIIKKGTFAEKIDEETEDGKPLSFYGIVAIFIVLLGSLISSFTSDTVLYEKIHNSGHYNFTVNTSAFLNQITIQSPSSSKLNNYRFTIYKNQKKIFYIDNKKVYFSKNSLGKTWSHNAIGANIYLKLDGGRYLLEVSRVDNQTTASSPISIKIEERIIRTSYLFPVFASVLLFFVYFIFRKYSLIQQIAFGCILLGIFGVPFLFFVGVILIFVSSFTKGSRDD